MKAKQWVATETWAHGILYEGGGIYDHEPHCRFTSAARPLKRGEHTAACPRCGQRFAATVDLTAEENRDLHFNGDEDCPSICKDNPSRVLVEAVKRIRAT